MDIIGDIASFLETYVGPVALIALVGLHVYSIFLARKEHRERIVYMERVESAAKVYSREAYEFLIMRLVQGADRCIFCYWHSLHSADLSSRYQVINEELTRQKSKDRDVRVITARDPSRLAGAFQLMSRDVPVRFHDALVATDLRFTLIDETCLIFGLPETTIGAHTPSREGVDLVGRKLTSLMRVYFTEQWNAALDYDTYASTEVKHHLQDPTNTMEMVGEQLRLPLAEIKRLLDFSPKLE